MQHPQTTPTPPAPRQHRWPQVWGPRFLQLLAFAILITAYRFITVKLSGISLFFDEAQYWDWSNHLDWGYYSKPPLVAALIWLSTLLFGDGVLGVKVLGMLTYPATALAMVLYARALWPTSGGVRTGVIAGGLYLTLPMVGLLGLVVSTDGALLLCWTLASWALWRAQVTNQLKYWAALGLICGIGIMDKYTMAAFALTAVWALWGVHGPQRGLFRPGPWVALLVAAMVVSPNILWNIQHHFPTLEHTAELTTQSNRSGGFGAAIVFVLGQALMLGPVAVVAGIWLTRRPYQQDADTIPASQWAPSTQLLPPGRPAPDAEHKAIAKNSPYYFAAVSSYRYLWMTSAPLLLVAVVQAFHADAHVNWAAPAMIGLTMLIASRLSPPLVPIATPKPNRWLVWVLVSNLLLTGIVVHLHALSGGNLPGKFDVMVRMRGWQETFDNLRPAITSPEVKGLPILSPQRLYLTQAVYHWRDLNVEVMAWNPEGKRQSHYQLMHSLPDKVGLDALLVTDTASPDAILQRFTDYKLLQSTKVMTAPDKAIELHVFVVRGFMGYTQQSYDDQTNVPSLDQP